MSDSEVQATEPPQATPPDASTMDDLFGDSDSGDEEAAPDGEDSAVSATGSASPSAQQELDERIKQLEYEEDDAPAIKKKKTSHSVALANFTLPKTDHLWHARLPHFLSLDPNPFDSELWDGDEETGDARPVPDENVIRWRWAKGVEEGAMVDPEDVKEAKTSNARIVRWSDNTLSLQVGDELFDMDVHLDSAVQATGPAESAADRIRASYSHSLAYIVARHNYAGLSETHASIPGHVLFRPATLQSNTHKRLAGAIHGRYLRTSQVKVGTLPSSDPEAASAPRPKPRVRKERTGRVKRDTRFYAGDTEEAMEGDRDGDGVGVVAREQDNEYDLEDDFLVDDEETEDEEEDEDDD